MAEMDSFVLPLQPCRALRRTRGTQKGSTLVEFGLVFILLMIMMLGILDFGRALYSYHFLSNAAREAARFGSVHGASCGLDSDGGSCTTTGGPAGPGNTGPITSYVSGITPPGIDSTQVTTTPTWPGNGTTVCSTTANAPSCPVEVQVSYNFKFLFSLVSSTGLTLTSTSQMTITH
jgi:TadE-like protein